MSPDPSDVQALFARHYFYFAALATLGALQIAVSIGGYSGLWLLPGRLLTRYFGILLILGGATLFFLLPLWSDGPWQAGSVEADSATRLWGKAGWGDLGAARNVNDVDGGLSGTGQATWFPLSAAIAVIVSIAAGTANRKLFPGRLVVDRDCQLDIGEPDGLDLLSTGDYRSALPRAWRRFRSELPGNAASLMAVADRWSFTLWSVERWKRRRQ